MVTRIYIGDTIGRVKRCKIEKNAFTRIFAQRVAVFRHGAHSVIDLDQYVWPIIFIGGEGLEILCWDSCVTSTELGQIFQSQFSIPWTKV